MKTPKLKKGWKLITGNHYALLIDPHGNLHEAARDHERVYPVSNNLAVTRAEANRIWDEAQRQVKHLDVFEATAKEREWAAIRLQEATAAHAKAREHYDKIHKQYTSMPTSVATIMETKAGFNVRHRTLADGTPCIRIGCMTVPLTACKKIINHINKLK